jgi:hypothetical protein
MGPSRRILALLCLLTLAMGACGGESNGTTRSEARQESGSAKGATPVPSAPATAGDDQTTLRIYRMRLRTGPEEGGDRLRVILGNASSALRVTVTGAIDQEDNAVTVCSVPDESAVPPSTQCVIPVADRPVDVPSGSDTRGVEISLSGRTTAVDLEEVAITYAAVDRKVRILLPNLDPTSDPWCEPRGCPSFEVTPRGDGEVSAQASWPEPGAGLLEIRTEVPEPATGASPSPGTYRALASSTSSSDSGPGSISTSATITSGRPSVVTLSNQGTGFLKTPTLEATWPQ